MRKLDKIIKVQIRATYGRDLIYPVNEVSRELCRLTGRKTWDRNQLRTLEKLGFILEWVPKSLDLSLDIEETNNDTID